jgi:hypothetical protein
MDDSDLKLRTVHLSYPRDKFKTISRSNTNAWLAMLELLLSNHYENYKITITQDTYNCCTDVEIVFSSLDDAMWFKLSQ